MSSAYGYQGDGPWNITDQDAYNLYSMAKNIGWVATKFYDVPMRQMMHELNDYIINTPGVTNATIRDFLGMSENYAWWLETMLGGGIEYRVFWFEARQPYLPSERLDNKLLQIILPFWIVTTAVLGLRLFARWKLMGRIRGFDWVMVVAYMFLLGMEISMVVFERTVGMFERIWDQSYSMHSARQPFLLAHDCLYYITACLIKTSLLLFYYSLTTLLVYRSMSLYTCFCCVTLAVSSCCVTVFACTPIAVWTDLFGGGCVIDKLLVNWSVGSINIFIDVLIWTMPLPLVYKLKLTRREKILACLTFSLGALACIACGFRLKAIDEGFYIVGGKTGKVEIYKWTIIELNLAVICASLPALRALAAAYWPKLTGKPHTPLGSNEDIEHITSVKSTAEEGSRLRGSQGFHYDEQPMTMVDSSGKESKSSLPIMTNS
ncbi:hypothetical protein ABW19_dt0202113 [Dactylella cylindrospora]|nr:hypothetical protein ABW19_dt0202113 [Dactylella cylindrospora]